MSRVLRYEVPVDDQWHEVVAGEPLHVDCRRAEVVEFWALEGAELTQTLRVFGTGQQLPPSAEPLRYLGSALTPETGGVKRGALVWHLFRKEPF